MAAVRAGARAGEIFVQMPEDRSGDMGFHPSPTPERRIAEIVPAVDHPPGRIVQVFGERAGRDEMGEGLMDCRVHFALP